MIFMHQIKVSLENVQWYCNLAQRKFMLFNVASGVIFVLYIKENIANNMAHIQCPEILIMSLASMCLMGVFQTIVFIVILIEEIKFKDSPFSALGIHCLTVIYATVVMTIVFAPIMIHSTGTKLAMFLGSISRIIFVLLIIHPILEITFILGIIFGIGSVLIWSAQGMFLVQNSSKSTISKHCAIFWILLQISVVGASAFVYFRFLDQEYMDSGMRKSVIGLLVGLSLTSVFIILFLPKFNDELNFHKNSNTGQLLYELLFETTALMRTKLMLLLFIPFFFLGLHIHFLSISYSILVGRVLRLERPKELNHFIGMFAGLGGISGGCALLAAAVNIDKSYRIMKVFIGFVSLITALFMVFINIPNEASFYDTDDSSVTEPSSILVIVSSFLLGIADACFNTQIIETLALIYPKMNYIVFPVFKLVQSAGVIVAIIYSTFMSLYGVLTVLAILSSFSVLCFIISESKISDPDKKLLCFGGATELGPKKDKSSSSKSTEHSSGPRTSTLSTSSESLEPNSSSHSQSYENTETQSDSDTSPIQGFISQFTSADSRISKKATTKEPKISKLTSAYRTTISFLRKILKYPNEIPPNVEEPSTSLHSFTSIKTNSTPEEEAMTSVSADKLSRLSGTSISPVISRPQTPSSIDQSETRISQPESPPISERNEQPSFLKRLMSIPLRMPWLTSEVGIKDARKLTTDDIEPATPIYPRVRVKTISTALSLRDDSSDTLSTRSDEQPSTRIDRGNIFNKGTLKAPNVSRSQSFEAIELRSTKPTSPKK